MVHRPFQKYVDMNDVKTDEKRMGLSLVFGQGIIQYTYTHKQIKERQRNQPSKENNANFFKWQS